MSASPPQTFWPPPPLAVKRYLAAYGLMAAFPLGCLLALVNIGLAAGDPAEAGGPGARLALVGLSLLAGLVLGLLLPLAGLWDLRRRLPLAVEAARASLQPGEVLQAVCPARPEGTPPELSASSFLVVSDRRVLTLSLARAAAADEELAVRVDVRRVEVAPRGRPGRLGAWLLESLGQARALTLVLRDGARPSFQCEVLVLDPLLAWLAAGGFQVGAPAPPASEGPGEDEAAPQTADDGADAPPEDDG